jgi:hypothetical protein
MPERHGAFQFSSKAELSSQQGASLQTSHPAGRRPHHGPAFGTGELQEGGTTLFDGGFMPGRTTATPPWIRVPAPLYSAGLIRKVNQDAGFMTAPSGTTPWVANRHKAIRSRRAIATTMTLRMRFPVPPTRSRNQMT